MRRIVHALVLVVSIGLVPVVAANAEPGGLIAYTTAPGADSPKVKTVRPDGSHMRTLMADASDPAWSPDGRRIAFVRRVGRSNEVFIAGADGSVRRRVTHSKAWESEPVWSPDGTRLAVVRSSLRDLNSAEIWIISLGSGTLTRVTDTNDRNREPAWSPDGRWIAFSSPRNSVPPEGTKDIWLWNVRTRRLVRFTRDRASDWAPAWAPDGRSIYFLSMRTGTSQIWRKTLNGRSKRLTGGVDIYSFDLSPSGQAAAVSWHVGANRCNLGVIRFSPRKAWRLTTNGCAEDPSWKRAG
jgi:TolB protein